MTLHTGDCLEVMAGMADASVDAVVTDPPYGIGFMGKAWDAFDADPVEASWSGRGRNTESKRNPAADTPGGRSTERTGFRDTNPRCGVCGRVTRGRDTAKGYKVCHCKTPVIVGTPNRDAQRYQAWTLAWAREAFRITVPGGYLLAFGGTRTHHRLVCGLEDAGWIIRDELDWIYASGFPKGKANLKPAHEPIVLARKPGPLRALGIDACRIPGQWSTWRRSDGTINPSAGFADEYVNGATRPDDVRNPEDPAGRWPSNLILTDPVFDGGVDGVVGGGEVKAATSFSRDGTGIFDFGSQPLQAGYGDSGTYSRFFLVPKSSRSDREPAIPPEWFEDGKRSNSHPTCKPVELMRHLVRLVTPTGGTVLDPFLGSGTTAIACEMEGFAWIGIEKEPEYVAIAEARLNGVQKGLGLPA